MTPKIEEKNSQQTKTKLQRHLYVKVAWYLQRGVVCHTYDV
jgi:hypothetical protein